MGRWKSQVQILSVRPSDAQTFINFVQKYFRKYGGISNPRIPFFRSESALNNFFLKLSWMQFLKRAEVGQPRLGKRTSCISHFQTSIKGCQPKAKISFYGFSTCLKLKRTGDETRKAKRDNREFH